MANDTELFSERLNRIQRERKRKGTGMGFVIHPDGIVTPIRNRSSRLRFAFPLKGLITALIVVVAVKAYIMWVLGTEAYVFEIEKLLAGAAYEQVAAMILLPDALSLWVVEQYNAIYAFMQAGFASSV